jgi:polar amino acid transport system permease protein
MAEDSGTATSGSAKAAPEAVRPEDIKAVPVRHPGRWVAAVIVLYIVVSLVDSAVTNPHLKWHVVGHYLFASEILHGVENTLLLTVIAMVIGVALGIVIAVMRRSDNPLLSNVAWVYIWIFRGTPVIVQLLFWGFIAALYPTITLGVPFGGPAIIHESANKLIAPFTAAILGLALNEAAYMAEIVRGGLLSVDEGQDEAACALGMTRAQTMRRIVLPQAMRVSIPPTGNETISMLKLTSLVIVIPINDLLFEAQTVYAATYQTIELLIVASFWYLIFTSILQTGQFYIERYYGRGNQRVQQKTLLETLWSRAFTRQRGEVPVGAQGNPGGTL